ncbi:MAG: hypothetical protein H8D24_02080 [Gammaproteobacteria bacterium]|uniref:Uncharacterized protein n=1 Tax=Candidatus Thiopontia autotrophica TaxID=2841688 RepID=A0A8J6PA75_9GAMM|nr:hypothetical protein [Candidatus Thiopontia autotrophica]MBL6969241.1 hypothetical protein [Gammaproteobacteria bacterium]
MDQKKVDRALEIVGQMGCEKTREIIRQLEAGEEVHPCENLSIDECKSMLEELKEVMAVYGDDCCPIPAVQS